MNNISKFGFGGYRVDNRVDEHFNALTKAVLNGITLIDTSTNYSDGGGEMLVGNVLDDLTGAGKIRRENVTIVTKAGYIQGRNYRYAHKKKEQGNPFENVVEYEEGMWHSINPDFLEDQLNRQLLRLDQNNPGGYIDAYLLHNPEYYLAYARLNAYDKTEAQTEYYKRIKRAFEFLEEKVKEGKIQHYGVSSNTFPSKNIMFDFTSLERIYETALEVSQNNHFKFVQMPFNLVESDAYFNRNFSDGRMNVLEYAASKDLKVLINRPLNAITNNGLVRLADFEYEPFIREEFLKFAEVVELLEDDFLREKFANIEITKEDFDLLNASMVFGRTLKNNWDKFGTIEHTNDLIEHFFANRINILIDFFEEKITDDDYNKQFDKYIKIVFRLLNMVSNYYKEFASKRSVFLHGIIDEYLDEAHRKLSLSEKAALIISSVPGVSSVLLGMRKEKYVDDILGITNAEPVKHYEKILNKISEEIKKVTGQENAHK
jgi:aryl-alcohol dehydrogenase-like predicted oxidoreductase